MSKNKNADSAVSDKQPRCFVEMIDQVIRAQGISVRDAKKIRKAIFACWGRALRRGEIVETPLGELQAKRAPKRRARISRLNKKPQLFVFRRERRIVFRPWPWMEIIPTIFYPEADVELLEKLGRKPWAMTEEEHQAHVQAVKAHVQAIEAARTAEADQARTKMSPYQIAAQAQRPLSDILPPPAPPPPSNRRRRR